MTTSELVKWRGANVPVLSPPEVSRATVQDYLNWVQYSQYNMGAPTPVTTYGNRPAEPISSSFEGFVWGMLYADGPVAAVEAYRLRVFGQAPLLYQEMADGRPGDFFDDERLDRLRTPWPGGNLGDLMKRALIYGDFGGNAFILDLEDELVLVRPDWVEIVLAKRMHRGGQVGWKQVGIMYYEGGLGMGDGVPFLPGEYAHFVPGLPDPLATYRGMSWLTPLVREVQADKSAGDHKVAFFENAASPNLAVSLPKEITPAQFKEFVDKMDSEHRGATQAYKTLYTAGGADVTVIGANMQQMDFSAVQGKGETRIANAGGVSPALLSFSEGMQGSSLNAGNFVPSKRNFVDTTMRDLWTNMSGSIQKMDAFAAPQDRVSRLSYDPRDIPFLRDDEQDIAQRQQTQATTLASLITAGFKPPSAQLFLVTDDPMSLEHSGLTSVQLMPPGSQDANADGVPDAEAAASDEYQQALDEFRSHLEPFWDEITRAEDDTVERSYYDVRVESGHEGGGRFRKLGDIAAALLNDWLDGKGDTDDPLDQFTQPQLKKIAEHHGIKTPPRAGKAALKLAILNDAKARHRDVHGGPAPRASFTLKGPDHRDLDVGVYVENKAGSKIFLRRESNGRPGTILESFDNLDALHGWAEEHGETELAKWARSEQGPVKAPAKVAKRVPASPRVIHAADADAWARAHYPAAEQLDPQDFDALRAYSQNEARFLNRRLRGESMTGRTDAASNAELDALQARLDAILTTHPTPEPITVARSAGSGRGFFGGRDPQSLVGTVITDPGYMSVSVAEKTQGSDFSRDKVQMRIDVPAGTPSFYLGDAAHVPGEQEMLLPRGSHMEVVSVEPTANGGWLVHARMVQAPGGVAKRVPAKKAAPTAKATDWHATLTPGQRRIARLMREQTVVADTDAPRLEQGLAGRVHLLTYADGSRLVIKTHNSADFIRTPRELTDAEQLGSLVVQAVGGKAPAVLRTGEHSIAEDYVPGRTDRDLLDLPGTQIRRELPDSDQGRLMGLADVLLQNNDRSSNYVLADNGDLWSIDHGSAFPDNYTIRLGQSLWTDHFLDQTGVAAENDMSPADMRVIRQRLERLKPEFEKLGRTDWFDGMMTRLDAVEAAARGDRSRIRGRGAAKAPAVPPAEQAARDRQAHLDRARAVSTAVGEVEELLSNGASDRALRHSITARGKLGTPPEVQARLLAAVGDEQALRGVLADVRREEGLTPIGTAGGGASFDPSLHQSIGGPIPAGAPVTVLRPGHRFDRAGIEGATLKADVQEGVATSVPEVPARPSAPRGATGQGAQAAAAVDPVDPTQRAALDRYGGDGGYVINNDLRAVDGRAADLQPRNRATVEALDSLMAASPLSSEIVVHRTMSSRNPFDRIDGPEVDNLDRDLTGETWTEHAYASTSADPRSDTHRPISLQITVPAGTPAISNAVLDGDEILLPRGLTFRVVADHGKDDRFVRHLDVEIVPSAPSSPTKAARVAKSTKAATIGDVTLGPTQLEVALGMADTPSIFGRYDYGDHVLGGAEGVVTHRGSRLPEGFASPRADIYKGRFAQRPGLTQDESRALDLYVLSSVADPLNTSLRAGNDTHGTARTTVRAPDGGHLTVDLDEVAAHLDAAIADSELTQETNLYRGALMRPADVGRLQPGAEFTELGYLSTTTDRSNAHGIISWRREKRDTRGRSPVLIKILAPQGTHAAVGHVEEDEVLLGRGRRMRVVDVLRPTRTGDVRVVTVELLPEGAPTGGSGRTVSNPLDEAPSVPGKVAKATPAKTARPAVKKAAPGVPPAEPASKTYPALDVEFVIGNQIATAGFGLGSDRAFSGRRQWDSLQSGKNYLIQADDRLQRQPPREVADWLDGEARRAARFDGKDDQDPHYLRDLAAQLREPEVTAAWEALRERHRDRLAAVSARLDATKTARPAKKAAPKTAGSDTATALVDAGDDPSAVAAILAPLNSSQLKDLARTYKITGASKMRRDELVSTLSERVRRGNLSTGVGETIAESAAKARQAPVEPHVARTVDGQPVRLDVGRGVFGNSRSTTGVYVGDADLGSIHVGDDGKVFVFGPTKSDRFSGWDVPRFPAGSTYEQAVDHLIKAYEDSKTADPVERAKAHVASLVPAFEGEGMGDRLLESSRWAPEGALARQAEVVPRTTLRLDGVTYHTPGTRASREFGDGEAARYDHFARTISMSPQWRSDYGRLLRANEDGHRTGWFTPTPDPASQASVVAHEFGHHVVKTISFGEWSPEQADALFPALEDALGIPRGSIHVPGSEPDKEGINDRLAQYSDVIREMISGYAAHHGGDRSSQFDEMLAEIWQEYSLMGDKARPHIRTLGAILARLAEEAAPQ